MKNSKESLKKEFLQFVYENRFIEYNDYSKWIQTKKGVSFDDLINVIEELIWEGRIIIVKNKKGNINTVLRNKKKFEKTKPLITIPEEYNKLKEGIPILKDTREKDDRSKYEDYVATVAVLKTMLFFMYTIPVMMLVVLPLSHLKEFDPKLEVPEIVIWIVFFVLEGLLLYLIIKGKMPLSKYKGHQAFSEKQMIIGANVFSVLTYIFFGVSFAGYIVRTVLNAAIILFVTVFFVTKSIVSKRFRWEIIFAIVIPLSHFFLPKYFPFGKYVKDF